MIVIDAYHRRTAALADDYILVKPGSDVALALGIMQILIQEKTVDQSFIDKYVSGYEELCSKILPTYTPSNVTSLTGVSTEKLIRLDRTYSQAKSPFIRIGHGFSRHRQGAMAVRTITMLPALIGAYNKPGGSALQSSGTENAINLNVITRPDLEKRLINKSINMVQLGRVLTSNTDSIMSLYVYHSNPATITPDQNRVIAGLRREDLFTVVHDRFLTDTATALYADIVLPAMFSVEQEDIYRSFDHYYLQRSPAILEAPGQAKSNWETFCLLAKTLGFKEKIFKRSEKEMVELVIKEISLSESDREALG
ncbi:MAG: hypothetical protein PWP31_1208 [Clostridia bacterium]|nr:hypothetical protein [Clostridia bacterium]